MTKATDVVASEGDRTAEKKAVAPFSAEGSIGKLQLPHRCPGGRAFGAELRNGFRRRAVMSSRICLRQTWKMQIAACPSIEYVSTDQIRGDR